MSDFNGRTIEGDINHYTGEPPVQHDPQLFLDALDRVLALPGVEAVRWHQYTPYFNDGEACVFSAGTAEVKIAGDNEDTDDDEYEGSEGFRSTYDLFTYGKDYRDKNFLTFGDVDGKVLFDGLEEFEAVLESGRHDVILNKKFGDPAVVTATQDSKFSVEFYDHD